MSGPPKNEFQPPSDQPTGKTLIIGKVEVDPDGARWIRPMTAHAEQVMNYQMAMQALIQSAMEYSENPNSETLQYLVEAAHLLRAHSPS